MVQSKKVLLEKVDTLDNVVDSLTRSMSTKKFSWCTTTMGISSLDFLSRNVCSPYMKIKQKWENVGYVLYSLHEA